MIKILGNDIMRSGVKIGWVTNNDLFNHAAKKIGYVVNDSIFDISGKKLAHLDGDYVYEYSTAKRRRIEDAISCINCSTYSNAMRVAIRLFFGD